MILPDFHDLAFNLCLISVDLRISASDLLSFLFLLFDIHSGSILFYIFLTKFFLKSCNGITKPVSLIFIFLNNILHFGQILLQLIYFCFQFLYFTPSSKQIAVVSEGTAGHGTSRV